jgi:hypothetical protein
MLYLIMSTAKTGIAILSLVIIIVIVLAVGTIVSPTIPEMTNNFLGSTFALGEGQQTAEGELMVGEEASPADYSNATKNYEPSDKEKEFVEGYKTCEKNKINFEIPEQGVTLSAEVIGQEEDKCITELYLIEAEGWAVFAIGQGATCKLSYEEVQNLSSLDIASVDCEGALYELAKMQ